MGSFSSFGFFPNTVFSCPFPEITIVDTNQVGALWPDIWMPPQYALAMYWRVKKWKFTFSIQWREVVNDSVINYSKEIEFSIGQLKITEEQEIDGIFVPNKDLLIGTIPTNENQLICGPKETEYEEEFIDEEGNVIVITNTFNRIFEGRVLGDASINAGPFAQASITWVKKPFPNSVTEPAIMIRDGEDGLEMSPAISFSARTNRWTIIRARSFPIAFENTYGTFNYKILGRTFSTNIYAFNTRTTEAPLSVFASLEAIEYWPYDPLDGDGPIYDTSSGAQIRNFP